LSYLTELRSRRGMTVPQARRLLRQRSYFSTVAVKIGDADGKISGLNTRYDETVRPALQIIGTDKRTSRAAGMHVLIMKDGRTIVLADTTITVEPSAEELADIAIMTADAARRFDLEPRVAMLSFSDFGSSEADSTAKVRRATAIAKAKRPDLVIEGEMQADTAFAATKASELFPFSALKGDANVLVFPDLNAANIAYKLLIHLAGAEYLGPILIGMGKPVHVLERTADVYEIVSMAAICAAEAFAQDRQ
jgi:malate dehydrogenase (oxaloacetate-decarboxylating)(NADP+)